MKVWSRDALQLVSELRRRPAMLGLPAAAAMLVVLWSAIGQSTPADPLARHQGAGGFAHGPWVAANGEDLSAVGITDSSAPRDDPGRPSSESIAARVHDGYPSRVEKASQPPTTSSIASRATGTPGDLGRPASTETVLYTWQDGDRTRTFALAPDWFVETRRTGRGLLTEVSPWWPEAIGEPVFRTESGDLAYLPGGMLLLLDPAWDRSRVERFFLEHGIALARLQNRSFGENAFFVETSPGEAALRLANSLAGQDGVLVSSPNWHRKAQPTSSGGEALELASELVLGTPVQGTIAAGADAGIYRITLPADTDVWVYTTGDTDTAGTLLDADGIEITANDNSLMPIGPFNFSIRTALGAGTYYLRVAGAGDSEAGSYTLHAVEVTDPGNSMETATKITVGSLTPGLVGEIDVFEFEISRPTYIWMMTTGEVNTRAILLDSSGAWVDESPQSGPNMNRADATIAGTTSRVLRAGTYYITVERFLDFRDRPGRYLLYLGEIGEPGSSMADATPLSVLEPASGRISSADDQDFFSITLEDDAYVFIDVLDFSFPEVAPLPLDVELIGQTTEAHLYVIGLDEWGWTQTTFQSRDILNTSIWGELEAGTYHIRVRSSPPNGYMGSYVIQVGVDTSHVDLAESCGAGSAPQSDPLFGCQWSLHNTNQYGPGAGHDIRVMDAWAVTRGEGISVALVDDGMDYLHRDLVDNVVRERNHDYDGGVHVLEPLHPHGTKVAGIIAARDNDVGVRGVAPRASIYAYDAISSDGFEDDHVVDAMTRHVEDTAVVNNSWGQGTSPGPKAMSASWDAAIRHGIERGFGGKGTVYVGSGGNGFRSGASSNLEELTNHVGVTAVCAVNYTDTRAFYSSLGANLWVCAPSGESRRATPEITTTTNGSRYVDTFDGTSAAAPVVSGVVALIRSINRDLTWRDVKLILAGSARKNDEHSPSWLTGAARYGSVGERYSFSHAYGFGVVDAGAAVALASSWTNVPAMRELEATSSRSGLRIPDRRGSSSPAPVTSTVTLDSYVEFVEFVELNIDWDHNSIRDLQIDLISPSGTVSQIVAAHDARGIAYRTRFRFGSARHLGENAVGVWTLRIADHFEEYDGAVESWTLKVYGHGYVPGFPSIASATPGSGSLLVEWNAPDDVGASPVTSYDLRYIRSDASARADHSWTLHTDVGTQGTPSYILPGLAADVPYDVQVRAVNAHGHGPWSDSIAAVAAPLVAPSISSVEPRTNALVVTGGTPAGADAGTVTSYDLRYIASEATSKASPNWTVLQDISRVGDGDVRHVIRGLQNGVSYDVQLRAANGSDQSDWSPTQVGTPEDGLPANCLRGAVNPGFSLVVFEGGTLADLVACAEGRHVTTLYALNAGEYVPYIVGAPDFATAPFRDLFPDGVPALLPLVVRSEGPVTPAPAAPAVTEPFAVCLRGEIGEGFSLVVYEGGSVDDLVTCAEGLGVTTVYALVEGAYVPYILGAPEFVTARFRALFPDGVPTATPLTVRGEGP